MAITRRLVAHHNNDDNQWLKVDHASRFIVNESDEWQFLFGPNSSLSTGTQILKIAAQLDTQTLSKIRLIGYLYNSKTGAVDNAGAITFKVYRAQDITVPRWDDLLLVTEAGVQQTNNYFFKEIDITALIGASLDGDTTLMIEVTATRLSTTYKDRLYVNHLGIFDSFLRLKNKVTFLEVTKLDE